MPDFTILHTNDFHNKLTTEKGQRLGLERLALADRGLLVDAGDAVGSGNITYLPQGEPILDLLTEVGYDAMCIGNREFHFSRKGFQSKVGRARFPVLCANVRSTDGKPSPVVPSLCFPCPGGKIIQLFGLCVPMITERMLARKVSSFVFDDPLKVGQSMVKALRNQSDLLVCLSHLGIAKDRALAELCPELDLIIGGHTHVTLPEGEQVRETLIVQTGCFAHSFGRVEVNWTEGRPRLSANLTEL